MYMFKDSHILEGRENMTRFWSGAAFGITICMFTFGRPTVYPFLRRPFPRAVFGGILFSGVSVFFAS